MFIVVNSSLFHNQTLLLFVTVLNRTFKTYQEILPCCNINFAKTMGYFLHFIKGFI